MVAVLLIVGSQISPVQGAAPAGIPATVATSSQATTAANAALTLVATSTNCVARVISTRASAVMLTFSDYAGQTPTGTFGHLQTASSTVVYDSSIYGCGLIKVYSYTADTITVTETR